MRGGVLNRSAVPYDIPVSQCIARRFKLDYGSDSPFEFVGPLVFPAQMIRSVVPWRPSSGLTQDCRPVPLDLFCNSSPISDASQLSLTTYAKYLVDSRFGYACAHAPSILQNENLPGCSLSTSSTTVQTGQQCRMTDRCMVAPAWCMSTPGYFFRASIPRPHTNRHMIFVAIVAHVKVSRP